MPLDTPQAYVCTPSSLIASNPCLACISEKELLASLLGIFAKASRDYANDLPKLLEDSACFTCLSKKQMLQALVTITGSDLLGENESVPDVIEFIKCLECASEKQIYAALIYLFCNLMTFTMDEQET